MDTRKTEYKEPLSTSPFFREFEDGQNADGYWIYQHMVLQLEDCVEILNVKYPQYNFYSYLTTPVVTIDNKRTG